MSQLFTSGGQSIGASMSASVLPMNTQVWFPLELTGITLLSKELSRVFSNTTIWRHQFLDSVQFSSVTQLCLTLQFHGSRPPCPLPGLPVHHQLPEFTQIHVNWVGMPSNHLILYRHLLLPPSIFPSIRVFSNESVLYIRWPKYWSFSFSISPSGTSGLISFRIDWLDLFAVQGTLKSLL